MVADLLVGPVNHRVRAAQAGHVVRLRPLVEGGHPREPGDVELVAKVLEDARVEPAEADPAAVRLDRRPRGLQELRREGLAEGAVVAVELNDPYSLPGKRSQQIVKRGGGRGWGQARTPWSVRTVDSNDSGSSSMKIFGS